MSVHLFYSRWKAKAEDARDSGIFRFARRTIFTWIPEMDAQPLAQHPISCEAHLNGEGGQSLTAHFVKFADKAASKFVERVMMTDLHRYIAVFLTGLVVTLLTTPYVRSLALRCGAVDLPNERRPHMRPTARGGGLAVILGVHAACLLTLGTQWLSPCNALDFTWWLHFVLGSAIVVIVGVIDDTRGLRPSLKLVGQIMAGLLMAFSGLRFENMCGLELLGALDSTLVILWIVGIINAFNLIDGLDGLASGLAIVSAVGLVGVLAFGHASGEFIVLAALVGACLGFLRHNLHPASIFLGDTGSMFLGFALGTLSLRVMTKDTFLLSFCIPMLVLGVPILDEMLAIWRRSVRWRLRRDLHSGARCGGLFQPDLDHLHHRLLKAGWSPTRVALSLCGIQAGLAGFGLLLTGLRSRAVGISLIAVLTIVVLLLRFLAFVELRDTWNLIRGGLGRPQRATFKALSRGRSHDAQNRR